MGPKYFVGRQSFWLKEQARARYTIQNEGFFLSILFLFIFELVFELVYEFVFVSEVVFIFSLFEVIFILRLIFIFEVVL